MKTKIEKKQKAPEQIFTAFCAEIRDYLREPVRTEDGQTKPRLYALLDRVCEKDPKAAVQLLSAYAFTKPAHRLEISLHQPHARRRREIAFVSLVSFV